MDAFKPLFAIGLLLLVSGGLVFCLPDALWRALTRPRSKLANQTSTGAALLFVGLGWLGLCLIAFNATDIVRGLRAMNWKETPAKVRESRLTSVSWFRSASPVHRPHVEYAYEVDGLIVVADRLSFGSRSWPGREAAEAELSERYSPGASLIAWVNPANPSDAVLEPGVAPISAIQAVLGIALSFVSVLQLRALRKDWSGEKSSGPAKAPYVVHRRRR